MSICEEFDIDSRWCEIYSEDKIRKCIEFIKKLDYLWIVYISQKSKCDSERIEREIMETNEQVTKCLEES